MGTLTDSGIQQTAVYNALEETRRLFVRQGFDFSNNAVHKRDFQGSRALETFDVLPDFTATAVPRKKFFMFQLFLWQR